MTVAVRLPDGTHRRFPHPAALGHWLRHNPQRGVIAVLNSEPREEVPGADSPFPPTSTPAPPRAARGPAEPAPPHGGAGTHEPPAPWAAPGRRHLTLA